MHLCHVQQFPLDDSSSHYNALWRMAAGAFAGMFATVFTHPIDVIRAKLTVQSHQHKVYRGVSSNLLHYVYHTLLGTHLGTITHILY